MNEMTRSDEQATQCPLLISESDCIRDKCKWWLELPLPLGFNGECRCAVMLFAMILHATLNAREER